MNEVIERLEIKIAFLEAANVELSDAVYRQRKELDALHERLTHLVSRIDELTNRPGEWTAREEIPPHY